MKLPLLFLLLCLKHEVADEEDEEDEENESIESDDEDDQADASNDTLSDKEEDEPEDDEGKLLFCTLTYQHHYQEKLLHSFV